MKNVIVPRSVILLSIELGCSNDAEGWNDVGNEELCHRTGLPEPTVKWALKFLRDHHLIEEQPSSRHHLSTRKRLIFDPENTYLQSLFSNPKGAN